MADGNWSAATYIDERADDAQTEALTAIFSGAAGGPMAAFTPLIGKNLGVSKVPITFRIDGKTRSAEIPGILHMSVDPLPTMHPSGRMWVNIGHPVIPDKMVMAVGAAGNTFSDRGMRWDNSGKNGLYASIRWSTPGRTSQLMTRTLSRYVRNRLPAASRPQSEIEVREDPQRC